MRPPTRSAFCPSTTLFRSGGAARYSHHDGDLRLSAERYLQEPSHGYRGTLPRYPCDGSCKYRSADSRRSPSWWEYRAAPPDRKSVVEGQKADLVGGRIH